MGSVTNSPQRSNENPDQVLTGDPSIYLLPGWIYRAFTAKFNLSEIHTYAKLRQVASIEDVAHLEILRLNALKMFAQERWPYLSPEALCSFVEKNWRAGQENMEMTPADIAEVKNSVNLLVGTPSVVSEAMDRFRTLKVKEECQAIAEPSLIPDAPKTSNEELSTHCRVVVLNTTLYIIVEEGFLSYLEGSAGHLAFLSQVLKSAYAVLPVRMVNRSSWCKQYLTALAA